jgi:hypothetical protein
MLLLKVLEHAYDSLSVETDYQSFFFVLIRLKAVSGLVHWQRPPLLLGRMGLFSVVKISIP